MIKKIIAVSVLGLLLSLPPSSFAQERNPQVLKALKTLKQKIGNNFRVEWSEDGSRIIGLEMAEWSETQSKKVPSLSLPEEIIGTPEEIAIAFLQNNSELFQIPKDLADLLIETTKEGMPGEYSVELQQTFDELPVLERKIYVDMDLKGSRFTLKGIVLVASSQVPNINISTTPMLSEQEAIAIAKKDALQNPIIHRDKSGKAFRAIDFNKNNSDVISEARNFKLGILITEQDEPVLVYKFFLSSVEYVIDANTGTIINVGDMAIYN